MQLLKYCIKIYTTIKILYLYLLILKRALRGYQVGFNTIFYSIVFIIPKRKNPGWDAFSFFTNGLGLTRYIKITPDTRKCLKTAW